MSAWTAAEDVALTESMQLPVQHSGSLRAKIGKLSVPMVVDTNNSRFEYGRQKKLQIPASFASRPSHCRSGTDIPALRIIAPGIGGYADFLLPLLISLCSLHRPR